MRKLSKVLPLHCLRTIYYSFVHSRLSYGISVWGGLISSSQMQSLFILQKKFLRLINKVGPLHKTSPLFVRNHILKLEDVLNLELILIMFNYHVKTLPKLVALLFTKRSHDYNTRNKELLVGSQHKTKLYNKTFMNKAPILWQKYNHLFEEVSTKSGIKNVSNMTAL